MKRSRPHFLIGYQEHWEHMGIPNEHIKKLSQDPQRTKMAAAQKGRVFNQRNRKRHNKVYSTAPVVPKTRKPYVKPEAAEFPIDDWFQTTQPIDVSIIVPMFKSSSEN